MSITEQKARLRAALKNQRHAMDAIACARANKSVALHALALPAFADANVVYTYLSMDEEVDTRAIIEAAWQASKRVALPYCVPGTRTMRWYYISSFDGLARNAFGVEEPVPSADREADPCRNERALALVPGLAFDLKGYRIGYGGGYYDRFLSTFEGVSVGLCHKEFLVDDLRALGVVDTFDIPVDIVVT